MATKRQRRKRRRRAAAPAPEGAVEPAAVAADDAKRARTARQRGAKAPPSPPWGSFPLSELVILVAIVLLLSGFFVSPPRGTVMIGTGLVLGSLAGLELAVREHFAGYKSHTLLLAGAIGVVVIGGLFAVGPDGLAPELRVAAGIVAFALGAYVFGAAFRRRSGGALFKV